MGSHVIRNLLHPVGFSPVRTARGGLDPLLQSRSADGARYDRIADHLAERPVDAEHARPAASASLVHRNSHFELHSYIATLSNAGVPFVHGGNPGDYRP